MMYSLEMVARSKRQETELEVAEMPRFTWGVTRMDRSRNDQIRGAVKVEHYRGKAREAKLTGFGHVQGRDSDQLDKGC